MQSHQKEITLEHVLKAKEERAGRQAELRKAYNTPVVSITINMPGNLKYTDVTVELIYKAMEKIRRRVKAAGFIIMEERIYHSCGGPCGMLAVRGDAHSLKKEAVLIESQEPYSRLLDVDVFDEQGRQITRESLDLKPRECIICRGAGAVHCMRAQTHNRVQLSAAVEKLLVNFQAEQTNLWPEPVAMLGSAALEAMLMEIACTPTPGLVDRFNSGAHRDMDFFTFIKSSSAINEAMYKCALAGWRHEGTPEKLLPILREIGLNAEKDMFLATDGVNTQKGILFLLGIVSAAQAWAIKRFPERFCVRETLSAASAICKGIVASELSVLKHNPPDRKLTAGERFYLELEITGVRGELEAGLPKVEQKGFLYLRKALEGGLSLNDALVHALIALMSVTEDTTILHRHGLETLTSVQKEAKLILDAGGMFTEEGRLLIDKLDVKYSDKGISPGGSADLLAVTYFLHIVENKIKFLRGKLLSNMR